MTKSRSRTLSSCLTFAAACAVALCTMACAEDEAPKTIDIDTSRLPTHQSVDVEVYFMDSNRVRAVLHAGEANVFENERKTFLRKGVKVEFMNSSGSSRVSVLTADSAEIDDRTKDMKAMGNVVVISDSSRTTLTTSLLLWEEQKRRIFGTEYVRIESPSEIITGYGFESDQYLKNYKIFKVSGKSFKTGSGN